MRKRVLAIAVFTLVVTAGFWYFINDTTAHRTTVPETGITVGKTAPSFTLQALDGGAVKIGKTGQITVLNFWATWCPPCREEMPELEVFATKHKNEIVFGAVNLQETVEKVRAFLDQNKYTMPVLLDTDGKAGSEFLIRAIPTTIILDKNGVIQFRKSGPVTADELEAVLKEVQAKS
jgi:thiol-disulfide isomerase/thioredoxin